MPMTFAPQDVRSDVLGPRPLMPVWCMGAIGVLLVSAIVAEMSWREYAGVLNACPRAACLVTAACSCAVVILMLHYARGSRLQANSMSFLLGALLASIACLFWAIGIDRATGAVGDASSFRAAVLVRGDPQPGSYGSGSVASIELDGSRLKVWLQTEEPLGAGTLCTVAGRLSKLPGNGWGRSLFMKGASGVLRAVSVSDVERRPSRIEAFRAKLLEAINPASDPARALLAGLLCGRTTELSSDESMEWFSQTGLTHLIAVSGGHLACIVSLLGSSLLKLPMCFRTRLVLLQAVMFIYTMFTGGSPSAVRSFVMVACATACRLLGRRAHPLSGLALAAGILALMNPGVVFDVGFQLSLASVLFIMLVAPVLRSTLCNWHIPDGLADQVSITLAAQWGTAPIVMPVFGSLSLISPVANIVVAPLFTCMLTAGLILAPIAMYTGSGSWLLAPLAMVGDVALFLTRALSEVPWASIAVESGVLTGVLLYAAGAWCYMKWRPLCLRGLLAGLAVGLVVFAGDYARWNVFAPAEVVVLDVGQGDAILIRDGDRTVLVDAGVDEATLRALVRNHVYELDAVVVTHWDRDHWGGLPAAMRQLPVRQLVVAHGASDNVPSELFTFMENGSVEEVSVGDRLKVGSFSCGVLWPLSRVGGEENSESLVFSVVCDELGQDQQILLTGDTEVNEEHEYARSAGNISILKMGHHGSRDSVDATLMNELDPEVAIASAGAGNRYGHPNSKAIDTVVEYGAGFYCTRDVGDVTIRPTSAGLRLRTRRANSIQ